MTGRVVIKAPPWILMTGVLTAAVATLAAAPAAQGALNSTPTPTDVTNGSVSAIIPTPSAIYIAGQFSEVGPRTGPGVGVDSSTAKSIGLPEISGPYQRLDAVSPDGSGGFYIGGSFTH